jgi:threonine dehydratase
MSQPTLENIVQTHKELSKDIIETPVHELRPNLYLKLELKQNSGSFKLRGALNFMRSMTEEQKKRGVTAFSAGNHAIAVAYAAKAMGISAKVNMFISANPLRIEKAQSYGAEVQIAPTKEELIGLSKKQESEEGRTLVHPFDHPKTIEGAAGVGLEFMKQVENLEVVFVPVGGGGLAAGVSAAIKQINPQCKVIGVQAPGVDAMYRSLKSGKPEKNENVVYLVDSLCPPQVGNYTLEVCKRYLDGVWRIEEAQIIETMRILKTELGFMIEGAGAIATAAALTAKQFADKKIGAIVSGSSIDEASFTKFTS